MTTTIASPAGDWIGYDQAHASLCPQALRLHEAFRAGIASPQFLDHFSDAERTAIRAAHQARLPRQIDFLRQSFCQRLCQEFSQASGYRILGKVIDPPTRVTGQGLLTVIDLSTASRGVPAGPCVFTSVPVEDYAKPIPASVICALAEARSGEFDIFENVLCIEPLLRKHSRDGGPVYFNSLAQVQAMMRPRTIDPLLIGTLPNVPEVAFCLAHWD